MKKDINKNWNLLIFAAEVLVAAAAIVVTANLMLGRVKFDITSDGRFSLSETTKEFLQKNQKNIAIRLYKDRNLAQKSPALERYAEDVRRLLEKYESAGGGKIDLTIVETVPFTNTQAEAEKAGIKEFWPEGSERYVYLGAVFTNENGRHVSIDRLIPERAEELESDVTQILSVLATDKRSVVGVISPLFRVAEEKNPLRYAKYYPFVEQIVGRGYEVVSLSAETMVIPKGVDAVLVFYPLNLSRLTVYALDQYLMRGGKIIIMMDAFSDMRFAGDDGFVDYNSGLDEFLRNNGVVYHHDVLVGNGANAKVATIDGKKIKYPLKPIVDGQDGAETQISEGLKEIYLSHSGFFEYHPGDDIRAKVLLKLGKNSGEMPVASLGSMSLETLSKDYLITNEEYPLAILLEGNFRSLFGAPLSYDPKIISALPPFLSVSIAEGKLLLIADSDMAAVSLWSQQYHDGQGVYETIYTSDNMRFLQRVVDYMTKSGYVTVALRGQKTKKLALRDVLYAKAEEYYLTARTAIEDNLLQIRQKKAKLTEQTNELKLPTAKQIKELEELQRQEANEVRGLEKVDYEIKAKYQSYRWSLIWSVVLVIPLIMGAGLWGVYSWYERRCRQKVSELMK